jgi:hypothetical protein
MENNLPKKGVDIPSPIDWEHASHYLNYDEVNFCVETWCKTGPNHEFNMRTRVRPMCESEIIHIKLKGHSREAVLNAFGYTPEKNTKSPMDISPLPPIAKSWLENFLEVFE